MPKVSVIMPSYNKEKYISKAIESILGQTFGDFELIIIDDGSSDGSVGVIRTYSDTRIRFSQNEANIGIAATRNIGLDKACGEYIALLDADDITTEFRLEREACFLDTYPDIDVVFGSFDEIDENDIPHETFFVPLKNPDYIKARLLVQDVIPNGSCMYRKSFVKRHDIWYRDGFLGMDDYLFWVECSLHGRITGMQDLFLHWRNLPGNSTNHYKYAGEYEAERRKKYAQIQKFALEGNGFSLTEEEMGLYARLLSEHHEKILEKQDILDLWQLFRKLCVQAEGMGNSKEIKKMYRKQFGLSLENSYIWD